MSDLTQQAVVLFAVLIALGYGYSQFGGRVRDLLSERFLYGIPWGSIITIFGVVGFYLFAQSGIKSWTDPVTVAFRSWSYFYPGGMLAAGFAHAGPAHLLGNMAGTVVLAPIAEYAWGHYPPTKTRQPTDLTEVTATDGMGNSGWLARPWFRAIVVFPVSIVALSLVTSVLALGWSLGFSGTVFALAGFAVVRYPLTTIVGLGAISTVNTLTRTLTEPVLRVTAEPGAPGPPGWASVNVQAHLLGFLFGVVLACYLVWRRGQRPPVARLFLGVVIFVFAQSLWVVALSPEADVYVMYRWVGVAFVLALSVLVTALVVASEKPLPRLLSRFDRRPTRTQLALLWLFVVSLVSGVTLWETLSEPAGTGGDVVLVFLFWTLLAAPALPPVFPDRVISTPISRRQALLSVLAVVLVITVIPSVYSNSPVLEDDPVPDDGSVAVGDYHISYVEDETTPRTSGISIVSQDDWGTSEGVVVVSEQREVWTEAITGAELAQDGKRTVVVGGVGWRETVEAERSGWTVIGNSTTFVVDLKYDGDRVRSFTSDRSTADARLDGHSFDIGPATGNFTVRVRRQGEVVGSTPIPAVSDSSMVGTVRFETTAHNGVVTLYAKTDDSRLAIAQREGY